MPAVFNAKYWNDEVFQAYMQTLPHERLNMLLKSGAIRQRQELAAALSEQTGGNYLTTPMTGRIGGAAVNYDGQTNITLDGLGTFDHSRIVVGRAKGWQELDFTFDITGGKDFMAEIAAQVSDYWDDIDEDTLTYIMSGIFAMTGAGNVDFVNAHTHDIRNVLNSANKLGQFDATTLNTAMQKASGDRKGNFSMVIMHSAVATNLENLNLLTYIKENDANGMQRDTGMATLNGRLVMIDDNVPHTTVPNTYKATTDVALATGKTYYTRSGSGTTQSPYVYTAVATPDVDDIATYYEVNDPEHIEYTTFVLGAGAIEYTNCGAKVPSEVDRDPKTNGGVDMLYTRQRKCWAPYGISFTKQSMSSASPTNAELANGANWALVKDSNSVSPTYFPHKYIPIAQIKSRG